MRGLFFCLLIVISAPSWSSTLNDEISQRLEKSESLRGEFIQHKHLSLLPQPLKSNGHFIYSQQQGLLWQTLAPLNSTLTFSHDGMNKPNAVIDAEKNKAKSAAMALFSQVFFALITTDMSLLARYFEIDGDNSSQQWTLQLTPKPGDIARVIKNLELRGDRQLQYIMFIDNNGDRTEIELQNVLTHPLTVHELQQLAR